MGRDIRCKCNTVTFDASLCAADETYSIIRPIKHDLRRKHRIVKAVPDTDSTAAIVQVLYHQIQMRMTYAVSRRFSAVLQFFQKSLITGAAGPDAQKKQEKLPLMNTFRHEAFSRLFVGNLTRGFANGTTTILAAAALSIGYDETLTSAMVSVSSVATLAACALFAVLAGIAR